MSNKYSLNVFSKVIWKNIIFIFVLIIIGGVGAGLYAKHKQSTTYTAHSQIIVGSNIKDLDYKNSAVQAELNMTKTYEDLIQDNRILSEAHRQLPKNLRKKVTVRDLKSEVDVDSRPNSLVLSISAETDKDNKSVEIANAVSKAAVQEIPQLSPSPVNAKVVSKAVKVDVTSHTKPSAKKYAVLGMALGALVGMAISFAVTTWKHLA